MTTRTRANPSDPARRGAVLVLALVVLALVGGLVLDAQVAARLRHRLEAARLEAVHLRQAATDAVRAALADLAEDEDLLLDHLEEPWAQPRESLTPSGIAVRVWIEDENRYFDLNNLAAPVRPGQREAAAIVADLFTLCGDFTPLERVEALRDWVDADGDGYYEAPRYRELERPVGPPNRPLYTWAELLRVEGFDRALFAPRPRRSYGEVFQGSLLDTVTVLPVPRVRPVPVNLNTAGRDVLLGVLGLEHEAAVQAVLTERRLRPVRRIEPYALAFDPDRFEPLRPYLAVHSTFFRVSASAYAEGSRQTAQALVRRAADGTVDVVQWVF